jgi:hypothetical protein
MISNIFIYLNMLSYQIYVYELDSNYEPSNKPSNILPYAVLEYQIENPHSFDKKILKLNNEYVFFNFLINVFL